MLSPSFDFRARDYLRLASAGVVVMGKSLREAVGNLVGILVFSTMGLLRVLKIIK
jgi:hypothetical protein